MKRILTVILCVVLYGCQTKDRASHVPREAPSNSPINLIEVPSPTNNDASCGLGYAQTLSSLGLIPNQVAIHGPVDEDAVDIGCPYRIQPPPGTKVSKGSTVTYRIWWERG